MCIIIRLTKAGLKNASILYFYLRIQQYQVRPTNSYQTYDLQHACSQSITNVISICRHQFCCNNTKGGSRRRQSCCSYPFSGQHRPNHVEMVFVNGFPLRDDFGALNYFFPTYFYFQVKSIFFNFLLYLTELQKDWHHLVLNLEKVQ